MNSSRRHTLNRRVRMVVTCAFLGLLIFQFQNCSDLKVGQDAVSFQSVLEMQMSDDALLLPNILKPDGLKLWVSADAGAQSLKPSSSAIGGSISLAPGASMPVYLSGPNVLGFADGSSMNSGLTDLGMQSDSYSVAVVLRGKLDGRILSINNGDPGSQELSLTVRDGLILAEHRTDATNASTRSGEIDPNTAGVVIAASFGGKASEISMQINGRPAPITNMTGFPSANSYLLRQLSLGGGQFALGEVMIFNRVLSTYELNTLTRLLASRWRISPINYIRYSETPEATPAPTWSTAGMALINANCLNCHHGNTYDDVHRNLAHMQPGDIIGALNYVPQMSAINVTNEEIELISQALQ